MRRWTVKKSPGGNWWAHEPACYRHVGVWLCVLFSTRCVNCKTFDKAYKWAETMAGIDKGGIMPRAGGWLK